MRHLAGGQGREGIRVNAISAGPLKPLAADGIEGLRNMLGDNASRAPLRPHV